MKKHLMMAGLCAALVIIHLTVTAQTTEQPSSATLVSATEHSGKALADGVVVARFKKPFPVPLTNPG